jgi:hypothetical protein
MTYQIAANSYLVVFTIITLFDISRCLVVDRAYCLRQRNASIDASFQTIKQPMRCIMNSDFGSLLWVNDKEGHEYVCIAKGNDNDKRDLDELSKNERATCSDVNDFIGTDRW